MRVTNQIQAGFFARLMHKEADRIFHADREVYSVYRALGRQGVPLRFG
jgi:hypothetical protein